MICGNIYTRWDVLQRQIKQIHKSKMTEDYGQVTVTKISIPKIEKNLNNRYHSQRLHQELDKEQYYIRALLHSYHSRCGTAVLLKKFHSPKVWLTHSFVEIDHEIFSSVILSLPLIQEGQLSVSGERMCKILVNHLED